MRFVGAVPLAGFSMKFVMRFFSVNSATPYLVGSSTLQRAMVAMALFFRCAARSSV
jgi:hypothetical protein